MKKKYLHPDDPILFLCRSCGQCCTGDTVILLNLFDLYRIARHLKVPDTDTLFKERIVELVPSQNGVPRPKLKFRDKPYSDCPFLRNRVEDDFSLTGLCALHPDLKPLVCKLAPVGRILDLVQDSVQYTLTAPAPGCPGMGSVSQEVLTENMEKYSRDFQDEKLFFGLLDSIIEAGLAVTPFMTEFYSFTITQPYNQVMESRKKMVANAAVDLKSPNR